MKKIFLLAAILFIARVGYAQNNLIGVWRASCPTPDALIPMGRPCDLCPTARDAARNVRSFSKKLPDSSNKKSAPEDFDFIVEMGGLTFTKDNSSIGMISYTWDKEKHLLSFSFKEKKYNFTASYGNQDIILKNDDGTLVVLKKKNVEIIR